MSCIGGITLRPHQVRTAEKDLREVRHHAASLRSNLYALHTADSISPLTDTDTPRSAASLAASFFNSRASLELIRTVLKSGCFVCGIVSLWLCDFY